MSINAPKLINQDIYRLIVGITGASGAILGVRLLEVCQKLEIETHLIISPAAQLTIEKETNWMLKDVMALASIGYDYHDIGSCLASGSFKTTAMVVIPCSIKTLSAIANCYANDLITRAADVTLKEGRPLALVVRETPLHSGHIRLMQLAARAGAVIFPPVPIFYTPQISIDDMITNIAGRVLSRLGIENDYYSRWSGSLNSTIKS